MEATHTQPDILLRNVSKFFNGEPAVQGIDLEIHQGEFFSILGPSGCGKTTILRLIAGFEKTDSGSILIRGQSMQRVPPYRRPVNTVFQSYALFNHLSVWDNVAFGLRLKKISPAEIRTRVEAALRLVKMAAWRSRLPTQLSGGQQQRVALARAIVNRPAVLLLDEPLSALDLQLRKEMQVELSNLQQDLALTFVMVTHDQAEALSLSDRIAVIDKGKIEQVGSPQQIYEQPQTPFVAGFIGDTNLFPGRVVAVEGSRLQILTETGLRIAVQLSAPLELSSSVVVSVRPENIQLSLAPVNIRENCFAGKIKHKMYLGPHVLCVVELESGVSLNVLQPNTIRDLDAQMSIFVYWAATDCLALAA